MVESQADWLCVTKQKTENWETSYKLYKLIWIMASAFFNLLCSKEFIKMDVDFIFSVWLPCLLKK